MQGTTTLSFQYLYLKVFRVTVVSLLISYNTMKEHGEIEGVTTFLTLAPHGQEWSDSQPVALPTYPPDRKLYNLVNKPTWCTNFLSMFISFLYMFWATICPLSGDITVSMRHLVLVTLYG